MKYLPKSSGGTVFDIIDLTDGVRADLNIPKPELKYKCQEFNAKALVKSLAKIDKQEITITAVSGSSEETFKYILNLNLNKINVVEYNTYLK